MAATLRKSSAGGTTYTSRQVRVKETDFMKLYCLRDLFSVPPCGKTEHRQTFRKRQPKGKVEGALGVNIVQLSQWIVYAGSCPV